MAHADIFERISRKDIANQETHFSSRSETAKEPAMDKKAVETIKLLGKQILEIREIIEQQTKTIKSLQGEVISLKKKCEDTEGNIKLAIIDQKDINKQIRTLKAAVSSHEYIDSRMPSREAFNQAAIRPMPQVQQALPQRPIQPTQAMRTAMPGPIQASAHRAAETSSGAPEMNSAYEEITAAINQARSQLGLEPHSDLVGTIKRQDRTYATIQQNQAAQKSQAKPNNEVAKSMQAENAAKEFIFGRIPKMLNLG